MAEPTSGRVQSVRPPDHRCQLGQSWGRHGEVVVCSTCGKWWRAYEPGNPNYATWKRAWVRQMLAGRTDV